MQNAAETCSTLNERHDQLLLLQRHDMQFLLFALVGNFCTP